MIKFYDTCSLLELQEAVFDDEEKFLISNITTNELQEIKDSFNKDEEIKWKVRRVISLLNKYPDKYDVIVYNNELDTLLKQVGLFPNNDSKIVISAFDCNNESNILFISYDAGCRRIAADLGIKTFCPDDTVEDNYTGYKEVITTIEDSAEFYTDLADKKNIYNLCENEYIILKTSDGEVLDKYKWKDGGYQPISYYKPDSIMFGKISAKNGDIYQLLALDSLNSNQMTVLRGPAGSGKSYLAFGHMFSMLENGRIDKIIIFCNTVATKGSAKLGFYPGDRTEKLLDSQVGNLLISKLGDRLQVERLIDDGKLVLLPFSDIRGYDTTGMNAAIYISEAQNLDIELMRLALQRIGEDSICIIDGDDATQVDMAMYAGARNGMKRVSKIFRGAEFYGEVTLVNIHRSGIAELAQKL